jgi:hypothetical protein
MENASIEALGPKQERNEEETPPGGECSTLPLSRVEIPLVDFPVHDLGPWPENLSLRREDLYGDQ